MLEENPVEYEKNWLGQKTETDASKDKRKRVNNVGRAISQKLLTNNLLK
jgi:hypothetical protein